ncbi:MAG: DUF72 domain-containing protein [Ferruginibacter sp.]
MTQKHKGIVRVGTSNVVVPGNKKSFPTEYHDKSRLNFYSSLLPSVEVNSTFYKLPMPSTFERWSMDVPNNFQFTIKLWREISHGKKLVYKWDDIDRFMQAADRLGLKKGCILIQFPGKITFDYYNQVEDILARLTEQDPHSTWRKALEFRSSTWYVNETHELLDEYGASIVLHDIPKSRNLLPNKTAKFIYLRYHGPTGNYRGSYSDEFLKDQSKKINAWLKTGKDVYAYFNNTMGSAFENAMSLKKMLGG